MRHMVEVRHSSSEGTVVEKSGREIRRVLVGLRLCA